MVVAMADQELERERTSLVETFDRFIDPFMAGLGFVWLALLIYEWTIGVTPFLTRVGTIIWIIFLIQFAVSLSLAPRKFAYVRRNWLTVLALALPALRAFRMVRVIRALRGAKGVHVLRFFTTLNRGMRSLGRVLHKRGFGYVVALTAIVTFTGGASIYYFENTGLETPPFPDYGAAVWWTAMIMTTMGSDYYPKTPEGRLICLALAIYAFAVFGYVTATVASYFVGVDKEEDEAGVQALRAEIRDLRTLLEDQRKTGKPPEP
jgi:voltage-gated potassium channel